MNKDLWLEEIRQNWREEEKGENIKNWWMNPRAAGTMGGKQRRGEMKEENGGSVENKWLLVIVVHKTDEHKFCILSKHYTLDQ